MGGGDGDDLPVTDLGLAEDGAAGMAGDNATAEKEELGGLAEKGAIAAAGEGSRAVTVVADDCGGLGGGFQRRGERYGRDVEGAFEEEEADIELGAVAA